MSVSRGTVKVCDLFDRAQVYSATPGHNGWTIADTSSSGSPTYLNTADGAKLTLASTSEAEIVTLFQDDVLVLPLGKLHYIEFDLQVAGIDAVTTLVAGIASAQEDTADSVAVHAWFRMEGSASTSAVVVETDDGTVDNNDVATGASLASVFKRFAIDFTHGLSDVRFFIDGARVATGTTFDMSSISSGQGVQPFIQLQKASGTGVPSVTIGRVEYQYNYAHGV